MTPAINLLKKHKITHQLHEYEHEASCEAYGQEAVEKLGLDENRVFKTLVIQIDNQQLAVAVIPVPCMLSMKLVAKALAVKKAAMADKQEVLRSTGYVLGGVSPLGQKKRLRTVIDASAEHFDTIYVSAGRRGLDLEMKPGDLKMLLKAEFATIIQ